MMGKYRKYMMPGLLAMLACGMAAGCSEDDTVSVLPTFSGFRITPSEPEVGQTVRIEAVQSQIGKLLYRADYKWTLTKSNGTKEEASSRAVYDNDPANPVFTYEISDSDPTGTYTISFSADYQYSAAAGSQVSGGTYDEEGGSTSGSIKVKNSGALYGTCAGSTTFQVRAKSE